ncbi:hypothetical protein MNBD_DELTA02-30 [hydrothermal vent metagenome]|uniref:Lipoprotein n=1 Tax=hydrothermal vent metagenome TaxID=652676 RepID=A0A3B0VZJ4_9ZZZZ
MKVKKPFIKAVTSLVLLTFLAGCSTSPNKISATYVSPLQYQNYSCNQISGELLQVSRKVSEVTGQQKKEANKDAVAMGVGLVLFWPALFFLAGGNDKKEELGRLKGEYEALEKIAIQKNCGVAETLQEARAEKEKAKAEQEKAAKANLLDEDEDEDF